MPVAAKRAVNKSNFWSDRQCRTLTYPLQGFEIGIQEAQIVQQLPQCQVGAGGPYGWALL